jgi:tRNA threonylcarbamoyladenosine biosynthesis protein TsaB
MIVLAFDTTSRRGSIALLRAGELLESRWIEAPDGFGSRLFSEIRETLGRHGLAVDEIDGFAAAAGPGSFTGIRIGLTAIKAMAEVSGKQVAGVSNLEALAELGEGLFRAPVMDARRGQVYAAVYDEEGQPIVDEAATNWETFLKLVEGRKVSFVGLDESLFAAEGAAALPSGFAPIVTSEPIAAAVARIAVRRFAADQGMDPEALDANYVRRPEAELNWKAPV